MSDEVYSVLMCGLDSAENQGRISLDEYRLARDWLAGVTTAPELPEGWRMNTHDCAVSQRGIEAMVDHHGLTVDWYGLDGMTETAIPLDVIRYLIARWEVTRGE